MNFSKTTRLNFLFFLMLALTSSHFNLAHGGGGGGEGRSGRNPIVRPDSGGGIGLRF